MNRPAIWAVSFCAACVPASASAQAALPDPVCYRADGKDVRTEPEIENINHGTLAHVRIERSSKSDTSAASDDQSGYFRLKAVYEPCVGPSPSEVDARTARQYQNESRWWGKRLFAHKILNKLLVVRASVEPLGVSSSKPLISMDRDSGKTNDKWVTDVENDVVILPYFKKGRDQFVNFDVVFSSDRTYDFSGAKTAVDILKQAASLIAPAGAMVNALNKDRFNQASTFVDSTVSGLLAASIKEDAHMDVALPASSSATAGTPAGKPPELLALTLYVPGANDIYPNSKWKMVPVGRWRILAEFLPGSIFSAPKDKDHPGKLSPDYSAAAIMNFKMTAEQRLRDAINQDEAVTKGREALLRVGDEGDPSDAALALCRAVALKTDSLGFTVDDAGLATWAYLTDMALPEKPRFAAFAACGKMDRFPGDQQLARTAVDRGEAAAKEAKEAKETKESRQGAKNKPAKTGR